MRDALVSEAYIENEKGCTYVQPFCLLTSLYFFRYVLRNYCISISVSQSGLSRMMMLDEINLALGLSETSDIFN